jgi:[acyl-carrier-protein] S-malonyltransferase
MSEIHAPVALIFPGQGSQSLGMLSDLAIEYTEIRSVFDEVSQVLGEDVWDLVSNGPVERLNQTEYTQVAMLAADVAVFRALKSRVALPEQLYFAGHSLGEYAALVCAEAVSLSDAAVLVRKRGQLMQETVPLGQGAMAAIVGLTDEEVQTLCQRVSHPNNHVEPANYNAIGQVVIAGHAQAVSLAVDEASRLGAKLAMVIPVSVPCHCELLRPASAHFESFVLNTRFTQPKYQVWSTVDVLPYQTAEGIQKNLIEQLYLPVRWVELIQKFHAQQHVRYLFECGPGKVLSGLVKRIERGLSVQSISSPDSLNEAVILLSQQKERT